MKRTKKLYLLLGVLLAVCGITFGVSKVEEHKEVIRNSDEIILTLEPDQVKSLSWENETEALAFHKTDEGNWVYDTDEAFPVDEEKITELLEQFTEFGVSFVIEEVEDFGLYGLDEPVCTINLETEEESYEILLGDYSKMDSKRYVSIGDGKAYLVQNDPLDYYDATLKDMIAHDEIPALDQVTQVVFSGSENYQISYEENSSNTYCDEDVYFTQKDEAVLPLDTTLVNGYLQNISALNPTEYVNYKVTEEELETYGLDDPELSVEIAYTKSDEEEKEVTDTFVLHVSRDPEEKAKAQEAENTETAEDTGEEAAMTEVTADESEEVTAYVRIGDSGIIYQIDGTAYENLMAASQNDLRHKEVFSGSFTDISQLDISLEDTVYTITSEKTGEDRTWYYQEEELETAALSGTLKALEADSFTEEEPTGQLEISMTLHLEHENADQVEISLYRYDGTHCLAKVDGKPVSLVERSLVVDFIEAVHAIVLE